MTKAVSFILFLFCLIFIAPTRPREGVLLRLNLPASRLDVIDGGVRVASYPVAIGSEKFRTPTGRFGINEITWNPWWIPPASDWARGEKPMAPGATNPMGEVKMRFAPFYFIHGSPDTSSIGHARSHGCVRMRNEDARILAAMLTGVEPPTRSDGKTRAPLVVKLPQSIPLEITYERIEASDSTVTLHPDPYKKGRVSIDTASAIVGGIQGSDVVDRERLRAFLALPATQRFVIPRSKLIR